MKRLAHPSLVLWATIVCVTPAMAVAQLLSDVDPSAVPAARFVREAADPTIARARHVAVDYTEIAEANPVALNLFPDVVLAAVPERVERRATGWTWFGHVGSTANRVILTVESGNLAGNVSVNGARYHIRPVSDTVHAVYEVRTGAYPECGGAVPIESSPGMERGGEGVEAGPDAGTWQVDDGSVFDVLVVYTPAAASAAGNIDTVIQLAIDETNDSYTNSDISTSVNLAHKESVMYTESGSFATDLSRLRATNDGYMDGVHDVRDEHCADQVTLLIDDNSSCGRAYIMDPVGAAFESWAFSVVHYSCATGYYSFGHEIGHNQSARHDRYVDNTDSPFAYNHGYVHTSATPSERWRTVMAYNDECSDLGYNCVRVQYWSNPDVDHLGDPTGTAADDNARCLDSTAYTVANFRQRRACQPGVPALSDEGIPLLVFGLAATGILLALWSRRQLA